MPDAVSEAPRRTFNKFASRPTPLIPGVPVYLTPEEAGNVVKCGAWTIRQALRTGKLKGYKRGGGWLTTPEFIKDWLQPVE